MYIERNRRLAAGEADSIHVSALVFNCVGMDRQGKLC